MRWDGWKRFAHLPLRFLANIQRIQQLVKKYERGDLPKSDWLDKMAFRKMEEIHAVRPFYLEQLDVFINFTLGLGRD
jgi:hypothetical protein